MSHTQSMERIMAMRGASGWGEELRTQKVCVVEEVLPGHGGPWPFAGGARCVVVLSSYHISPHHHHPRPPVVAHNRSRRQHCLLVIIMI